ncbi:MAG TPA: hypothetical protein DCG54_13180, partial [Anaerolineae bacterium]|nr:hypothetical protein [Anaerolineae bacterium]
MNRKFTLMVVIGALLLASLACGFFVPNQASPAAIIPTLEPGQPVVPLVINPDVLDEQNLLIALYERVYPGVVSLQVLTPNGGGQGSGFVYDKLGHIVTNYHVVENATQIEVIFPSGLRTYGEIRG